MKPLVIAILALFLLASCEGEPSDVELFVDLRTDYVPTLEFASVRTELTRADGTGTTTSMERAVSLDDDYITGQRIAELTASPAAYSLVVTLLHEDGRRIASRRVVVTLTESTGVTVLATRSCGSVTCPPAGSPDATECLGGRCVSPDCSPESPETCGPADCTSPTDCMPAAACAVGICDSVGACFFASRSDACPMDQWCNPDLGCVPRSGVVCAAGMGDCDEMPANGCETPLDTATDCGACGVPCAPPGAFSACADGDCALVGCMPGQSECDGIVANGCETAGDCACDTGTCTFTCPVGCTASCAAGADCTVICVRGTPCEVTAEMGAMISLMCEGVTYTTICNEPTCTVGCDNRCNCGG